MGENGRSLDRACSGEAASRANVGIECSGSIVVSILGKRTSRSNRNCYGQARHRFLLR